VRKGRRGQFPPQLGRGAALGRNLLQDRRVLPGIRGNRGKGVVLGRGTDHGRPANVDLLDRLFQRHAGPGHGSLERIQVDHDQLEGHDAVFGQRSQVVGMVVPAKYPAMDLRMEGLESAVHHLGEAGVLGHVADRDALGLQVAARAAGAVDFHASRRQSAGETGQPELVADANQRTLDTRRHGRSRPKG
jgi:hypothetical protein